VYAVALAPAASRLTPAVLTARVPSRDALHVHALFVFRVPVSGPQRRLELVPHERVLWAIHVAGDDWRRHPRFPGGWGEAVEGTRWEGQGYEAVFDA